jgi:hypothetical protein
MGNNNKRNWIFIIGLGLVLMSYVPSCYAFFSISSVVHYAIETGSNVALNLFLPAFCAGILNILGFILVVIGYIKRVD